MVRAWLKLLWNSAAVAAVAVAAQLGVADVLGIIRWQSDQPLRTSDWNAQLTWVAFTFTVAVLVGALAGRRAIAKTGVTAGVVATLLAALGAAAAVGLAWLPAHDAAHPVRIDPALVVSITAGAGVVVGIVVALIALAAPPFAAGARVTVAWLWLMAIGCAVAGILTHEAYPAPRLGVLDVPSLVTANQWTGPRLMIGVAALLGLVVAGIARAYGAGRFGIALAGLAGPAVVASAYLIAGPGEGADRAVQFDPYVASLIAAGAGLVASVLVAMPGRRAPRPETPDAALDDLMPLRGEIVPPPMPPAFATAPPPFSTVDIPGPEPVTTGGRRGAHAAMDFPTSEQNVVPAQGGYAGTTYGGTTYGSAAAPGAVPVIGQPPAADSHASWLRDLGAPSTGRHAADR